MLSEGMPAVEIADVLISSAYARRVSDIHVEPMMKNGRIRFRHYGILKEVAILSTSKMVALVNRFKVMGHMDLGENRLPQDGSCHWKVDEKELDLRFSVMPSLYGEHVVIRLLPRHLPFIEENELGMLPVQKSLFLKALSEKRGLILTAGATGSGKTSTLYTALKILCTEAVHAVSIENPIEYRVHGMTQVEVNEKAGLTFSEGLKALVRQDPDIVMIGEIRDGETARIAVHAALTGHLVLSSLHTTSVMQAPLRLLDMGISSSLLADALSLVISQQLVSVHDIDIKSKKEYVKRTGIFEMMAIGEKEKQVIREKNIHELPRLMKEQGQPSLLEVWEQKIKKGILIKS